MRNPERIDIFCSELARIWKKNCPDWRFGQLFMNIIDADPFYWEEDEFIKKIRNYFNDPIKDDRCSVCGVTFECSMEDMPCGYRSVYKKCTDVCPDFNRCSACIHFDY